MGFEQADAAIAALVHRYAELLDSGDLDGVAALFERATWRSGGIVRRGPDEVRRAYDRVRLSEDGTPRTRHVLSNLVVHVDAALTATSRCSFTVLQAALHGPGPVRPILAGRYHDAFALGTDGTWHFTDRRFDVDLVGDLTGHYG